MSVRPITESERRQAYGEPITPLLMAFGASQGLLTHLRFNGISVHQPWMSTNHARCTLPLLVIGGAVAGAAFGIQFFGDAGLRRLDAQHTQDRAYKVES